MYEFMILSLLAQAPMHGYRIRQLIDKILGPYRSVAWAPLYTTMRKLQGAELIELAPGQPDGDSSPEDGRGGPPCKRYRLTAIGHARFQELMTMPHGPEPEYNVTFALKIARMGHISPEQRLALFTDYRGYCEAHLAHLETCCREITESSQLLEDHRAWILLTMQRWQAIWAADAAWTAGQIRRLEHECMPMEPGALAGAGSLELREIG